MPRDVDDDDAAEFKSSSPCAEEKASSSERTRETKTEAMVSDTKDTGDGNAILGRAIQYCWGDTFLDTFRSFFARHAYHFEEAVNRGDDVHELEFTELFNEYLALFEGTLERFLEKEGSDVEAFYEQVKRVKENSTDPHELEFVDALLASADYESFYKVMIKEAKRQKRKKGFTADPERKEASRK